MNNAAMTRIDFEEEGSRIQYTDRAAFLQREMIT
jgi:hypothetical protein